MQVQLNDKVGFGYKIRIKRSSITRNQPEALKQVVDAINQSGIKSPRNPYGKNTNLKVVIQALDLNRFWDCCKFGKRIRPETSRYQFSIKFYNNADNFLLRMKRLARKVQAFMCPHNSKDRYVNKPVLVIKGGGSSLSRAIENTNGHITSVAEAFVRK